MNMNIKTKLTYGIGLFICLDHFIRGIGYKKHS